jgi:hypothetical protein
MDAVPDPGVVDDHALDLLTEGAERPVLTHSILSVT